MDAGALRQRIEIQRPVCGRDENGFEMVKYCPLKTVWAKVNGLFGKEWWEAKSYDAENTVEFTIRYNACRDLTLRDRILFRGRLYNITSIDNVLFRNEFLKIKGTADLSGEGTEEHGGFIE